MSNNKFAIPGTRKNQSKNILNSKSRRSSDGGLLMAIPFPLFLCDETKGNILINMAAYVEEYIERENIKTVEEWDIMADNEDFKKKTFHRFMNDYCKLCYYDLKIDMIKSASIFLDTVTDLMNQNRKWCDSIVTPHTQLKYELLPILLACACLINRNIELAAPEFITEFKKREKEVA